MFKIGDKEINKISGPVSCHYLKPRDEIFSKFKENGIKLPILLLFGDVHGSSLNMCDDCEKKEGCYRIYDKELLQLLDRLSTDEHPIDFYVEVFKDYEYQRRYLPYDEKAVILDKKQPLCIMCHGDTEFCFKRDKRGTAEYEEKCPTRNIRWHYSDPRQNYEFIEGNISLLSFYLKIIDTIDVFPKNIRFIEIIKNLFLKLGEGIPIFSKYFFENIGSLSILSKQIKKNLPFISGDISEDLLVFLINSQSFFYKEPDYSKFKIDSINNYIELIENIDNVEFVKKYKQKYPIPFQYFVNFIKKVVSSFLDLYFITRVLKGSNQASMVVAYLGLNHIDNIKYIFEDIIGYTVNMNIGLKIFVDKDITNRCLSFIGGVHENIDLSKDIREHNQKRQ